ncbi:hypothetical protein BPOR_0113g00050 [Botrytis porri]|uniref:Uncharacterized protein n=1 Tax=Botrytis porri TaxID=87229 RepID=A0A4Z1KXW3_9HELO|nr:hypothetical protein BPOR_0113g00050 [Botrytis porri]
MVWEIKELSKNDVEARNFIVQAGYKYPQYFASPVERNKLFLCCRHNFMPPCECSDCVQQFRFRDDQEHKITAYSFAPCDAEARQEAEGFTTDISRNLVYLRQQCQNNGDSII